MCLGVFFLQNVTKTSIREEVDAAIKWRRGGGQNTFSNVHINIKIQITPKMKLLLLLRFFAALQMIDSTILLLISPHKRLYLSFFYKNNANKNLRLRFPLRVLKSPDLRGLYKPALEKVPRVET